MAGADAIAFVIEIVTFTQANGRIGLLFTPNTAVHPQLGRCLWYTLASLVATVGAFMFLLIALPPKTVSPKHPTAYRDMVQNERNHGTDYSRRYSVEKAGRAGHRNGYADGIDRRSSRRSAGYGSDYVAASHPRRSASRNSRRSEGGRSGGGGRLKAQLDSDDEDVGRSSRRSRRREPDSEEELSDGY